MLLLLQVHDTFFERPCLACDPTFLVFRILNAVEFAGVGWILIENLLPLRIFLGSRNAIKASWCCQLKVDIQL